MSLALLSLSLLCLDGFKKPVFSRYNRKDPHMNALYCGSVQKTYTDSSLMTRQFGEGEVNKILTTPLPLAKAIIFCHLPWSLGSPIFQPLAMWIFTHESAACRNWVNLWSIYYILFFSSEIISSFAMALIVESESSIHKSILVAKWRLL